jgi:hypothetical protein
MDAQRSGTGGDDVDAKRAKTGDRRRDIGAGGESIDAGHTARDRAKHDVAMGDGFVARNPKRAAQRRSRLQMQCMSRHPSLNLVRFICYLLRAHGD